MVSREPGPGRCEGLRLFAPRPRGVERRNPRPTEPRLAIILRRRAVGTCARGSEGRGRKHSSCSPNGGGGVLTPRPPFRGQRVLRPPPSTPPAPPPRSLFASASVP